MIKYKNLQKKNFQQKHAPDALKHTSVATTKRKIIKKKKKLMKLNDKINNIY